MGSIPRKAVRRAAVAGMFYPASPSRLRNQIVDLFESAEGLDFQGEIQGLVCPHAGYIYSGSVAAVAYRQLRGHDYSTVAIISPSHREPFVGVSVFDGKGYETPLGVVEVDSEKAEALISQSEFISSSWAGHLSEHALEVQLPFLQMALDNFRLLPIVMGEQSMLTCEILGRALAKVLEGEPTLIVASSDLSHKHDYGTAVEIDHRTVNLIESFDVQRFKLELDQGQSEACGAGPIIASMIASKSVGARQARVLLYSNSGDVGGDHSEVVGYLSAAFGILN